MFLLPFLACFSQEFLRDLTIHNAIGDREFDFNDSNDTISFQVDNFPYIFFIPFNHGYRGLVYNGSGIKIGDIRSNKKKEFNNYYTAYFKKSFGFVRIKRTHYNEVKARAFGVRLPYVDHAQDCKELLITTESDYTITNPTFEQDKLCAWVIGPADSKFTVTNGGVSSLQIATSEKEFESKWSKVEGTKEYERTSVFLKWTKTAGKAITVQRTDKVTPISTSFKGDITQIIKPYAAPANKEGDILMISAEGKIEEDPDTPDVPGPGPDTPDVPDTPEETPKPIIYETNVDKGVSKWSWLWIVIIVAIYVLIILIALICGCATGKPGDAMELVFFVACFCVLICGN